MAASAHPYLQLPASRYWKSGVAERGSSGYADIWTPRHAISRNTRFATSGSCFAQHISRWLRLQGYGWVDAEPAPATADAQQRQDGGYGVFSFRTGNIYSAALLRQWVEWALGRRPVVVEAVQQQGRWYDPFRPLLPAAGLDSAQAVHEARLLSLECMREAFLRTDVFVFTLGLTEAWRHADGHVYPLCPGTVRGDFDPGLHHFVNQDAEAVVADLNATFDALRAHNPALRFLLTVSPVPLTATASDAHVLVATTWSKSVLRAAAGTLVSQRADCDYFPSYELISAFSERGQWYEPNLRGVTEQGVAHVMAHFGRALGVATPEAAPPARPAATPALPQNAGAAAAVAPQVQAEAAGSDDELVCEEVLLQTWCPSTTPPEQLPLCLLGDSHMGLLSQALRAQGVAHCGGMVMRGSAWFAGRFHPDDDECLVPLDDRGARQRWQQAVGFVLADHKPQASVLTNLGMQTHVAVPAMLDWLQKRNGHLQLKAADVAEFIQQAQARCLDRLAWLLRRGLRVLVVTDPPTQDISARQKPLVAAYEAYDLVASRLLNGMGCEVLNARTVFCAQGPLPADFYAQPDDQGQVDDWLHGSTAYYAALASAITQRWKLGSVD